MTLERLVTDLATSQQLRDKGFPQDTALEWCQPSWGPIDKGLPYVETRGDIYRPRDDDVLCAAPTAGELEEWLAVRGFSLETWYGTDSLYHIEQRGYVFRGNKPLVVKDAIHVAALAALVLEVAG